MTDLRRVYWDANAWLGLINREAGKVRALEIIYAAAKKNEIEIWTSAISFAEVYKMKDDPAAPRPLDEQNKIIAAVLEQQFIQLVEVNTIIGASARALLQKHPELKKPYDAIHLASAAHWNLHALHTYDNANLLPLNGLVYRRDGKALEICKPDLDADGPLFGKGG
ncbi:type II toxin-antitoxin system VapC family toxin [Reyranella sp.]|uniref:type II toxin-antitoxin system VapC family toxin n=1 Tax=Reyranella sp. TaxID=1929291 RepID=UPI0037852E58